MFLYSTFWVKNIKLILVYSREGVTVAEKSPRSQQAL